MATWFIVTAAALVAVWGRWRRSGLGWFDFVILHGARVYAHLWHRWSCNRLAPLPATGPALMIANHTCSADPAFLLAGCRRAVSFLVAHEHYDVHPCTRHILEHLRCIAVRRDGRDPIALRRTLRRLREGHIVCLFPEGNLSGISRERALPPKHGIGYLALKTKLPVYLAHITGGPRTHKLLYSWLRPTPKAVRVYFEGPVDLSAYLLRPLSRGLIEAVTRHLMERIYQLGHDSSR